MKIICLDTETTGLDRTRDELLQLAIIDGDGQVLFNERFKPQHKISWINAEEIHGISPADVANCKPFLFYKQRIEAILRDADVVVGYNLYNFDLTFLYNAGVNYSILDGKKIVDVMLAFAPIFGEWMSSKSGYKWQKLQTCAEYYGYSGTQWHDALDDTQATLFCFYKIFGKPPIIPAEAGGVFVHKAVYSASAPTQPTKAEKKPLSRTRCIVYALLWFFLSGGALFPVSIYYLYKAWKTPQ